MTSVAPNSGPLAGGNLVFITGTGFALATEVRFGATNATSFTVSSATQIVAIAPPGTLGTVDVTVVEPSGTSAISVADQFTYVALPTVTSINPLRGGESGGTTVLISGTDFLGATSVKFGTAEAAAFSVASATSISATVPPGTGVVDVTVTTPGGTSAINPAYPFVYLKPPSISTSFSPSTIAAGGTSQLTYTITNPNTTVALTAVSFNNTLPPALSATSSTTTCSGTASFSASSVQLNSSQLAANSSCNVVVTLPRRPVP